MFLPFIVIIMGLVVGFSFLNEKLFHITREIALMLFAVILGVFIIATGAVFSWHPTLKLLTNLHLIDIEDFLMHGVLCFMLFAGSCHMRLSDFRKQARQVTVLSILATLLGAVFYGLLFYGVSCLLGLSFSIPMCLMFGSIVAPTDPIAATSILKKFGFPQKLGFLIEGESLMNDGVGVALFVCFSGMVAASGNGGGIGGFFATLGRELFGAVGIGIAVSLVSFLVFYFTKDIKLQISASIFAVACAYLLCEEFNFSGAIASVVCGVMYSTFIYKAEEKFGRKWDLHEYEVFWDIVDYLLNSVLYVMLGLSFVTLLKMEYTVILSAAAIVINLIARSASLGISTLVMGPVPDGFSKSGFIKLFTWGGLRGGLCIALAMSTKGMLSAEIYNIVLGCTYAIAFFTTVVQGLTMKKVYDRITVKMH